MDTTKGDKNKKIKDIFLKKILEISDLIEKTNVEYYPFPYIMVESDFSNIKFEDLEKLSNNYSKEHGRENYRINFDWDGEHFSKLETLIKKKFNIKEPIPKFDDEDKIYIHKAVSANLWADDSTLDISDIHLDYLIRDSGRDGYVQCETDDTNQTVFSMHIYLPDDNEHMDLGTSIYSFLGNVHEHDFNYLFIKPDYPILINTLVGHDEVLIQKYFKKEKTIPFKKGIVYIHPTTKESWHSAPKVPIGYIRKSFMVRWSWTQYEKKLF